MLEAEITGATTELLFSPRGFQGERPSAPRSSFYGTSVHNQQCPSLHKQLESIIGLCLRRVDIFIHLMQEMKSTGKYGF